MAFAPTGRIPVRPLSYEYVDLVLPKELVINYVDGEMYICLQDGTLMSVSDSMIQHVKDLTDLADYIEIEVGDGKIIMLSELYALITKEYNETINNTNFAGSSEPFGPANSVANPLTITSQKYQYKEDDNGNIVKDSDGNPVEYKMTNEIEYDGSSAVSVDLGEFIGAFICYWISTDGVTEDPSGGESNEGYIDTGETDTSDQEDSGGGVTEDEGGDSDTGGEEVEDDENVDTDEPEEEDYADTVLNADLPSSNSYFYASISSSDASTAATALQTEVEEALSTNTSPATFTQYLASGSTLVTWLNIYYTKISAVGSTLASPVSVDTSSDSQSTDAIVLYYDENSGNWIQVADSSIVETNSSTYVGYVYANFNITGTVAVAVYLTKGSIIYTEDTTLNSTLPESNSYFSYTISDNASDAVASLEATISGGDVPSAFSTNAAEGDSFIEYLGCYTLTTNSTDAATLASPVAISNDTSNGAIVIYYDEDSNTWTNVSDAYIATVDGVKYVYATFDTKKAIAVAVYTIYNEANVEVSGS